RDRYEGPSIIPIDPRHVSITALAGYCDVQILISVIIPELRIPKADVHQVGLHLGKQAILIPEQIGRESACRDAREQEVRISVVVVIAPRHGSGIQVRKLHVGGGKIAVTIVEQEDGSTLERR